ncbi:MAG: glycosyltransferase [Cyanobacteria bacterium]|nr:glycosyltransferase [Cyanobacteriota bacterium]
MPRGVYQNHEYFSNPHIDKPLEAIYQDLDLWTWEIFPESASSWPYIEWYEVLPPTWYEGAFVKGICFTNGADTLRQECPHLFDFFNVLAYSGWSAFPWSETADGYLMVYENPEREAWLRKRYPYTENKPILPYEGPCEFIHEYLFPSPMPQERDIDVLCVSRFQDLKNIPMLAKGLKVYRQKYPQQPIRMTLVVGNQYEVNLDDFRGKHSIIAYQEMEEILVNPQDYIDFVPSLKWYQEIYAYYHRAKVCVLGSLFEGRNRSIHEAMMCNTPVVCFQAFNQYARGKTPILPEGGGTYAQFNPESLADTLYETLHTDKHFTPRKAFLKQYGRMNFLNHLLEDLPYYHETLPGFISKNKGEDVSSVPPHSDNIWLQLAVHDNHQMSLSQHLYRETLYPPSMIGLQGIQDICARYHQQYRKVLGLKTFVVNIPS